MVSPKPHTRLPFKPPAEPVEGYFRPGGRAAFMGQAAALFDQTQVISQLRANQLVRARNKKTNLETYFAKQSPCTRKISLRGQEKVVTFAAARLYVYAHQAKRLVIALKYEGETDYRYLLASDLSWRIEEVLEVYGLRWLVEVFFQDLGPVDQAARRSWIKPKPDPAA